LATILVVDDDANNRLLIATVLRHAGHKVLEAADAGTTLELVRQTAPDLLLIDLHLKGVSGADLIKDLRADERIPPVRIALYTATPESALLREFMAMMGIHHIVPKPADPRTIQRCVEEALTSPELQ